jgi:hypothetical protein
LTAPSYAASVRVLDVKFAHDRREWMVRVRPADASWFRFPIEPAQLDSWRVRVGTDVTLRVDA